MDGLVARIRTVGSCWLCSKDFHHQIYNVILVKSIDILAHIGHVDQVQYFNFNHHIIRVHHVHPNHHNKICTRVEEFARFPMRLTAYM